MSENNLPEEGDAPAKGKKPIMLAIFLVAGIAVGGGAGAFLAGPMLAKMVLGPATAEAATEGEAHAEEAEGGHGAEARPVYQIDNLVLNPAQSGGTRFLMLTIAFDLKDEAMVETMTARDAEVRDAVLTILSAKTLEQLVDVGSRDTLKAEMKNSVAALFPEGSVTQIYLPQFVIQ